MMTYILQPNERELVEKYVQAVVCKGTELLIPDDQLEDLLGEVKMLAITRMLAEDNGDTGSRDRGQLIHELAWSAENGSALPGPEVELRSGPNDSPRCWSGAAPGNMTRKSRRRLAFAAWAVAAIIRRPVR